MQLQKAIQNVFLQLDLSLQELTTDQYIQPSKTLFNATIGQHVRHIIELFVCLEEGYEKGLVKYDKRRRDRRIETGKDLAITHLKQVYNGLGKENKELVLEAEYTDDAEAPLQFNTNYYREIAYNLEHTIHHMALIKVGIREVSDLEIPEGFGVASSTIKYLKKCAQ